MNQAANISMNPSSWIGVIDISPACHAINVIVFAVCALVVIYYLIRIILDMLEGIDSKTIVLSIIAVILAGIYMKM